MWRKNKDKDKNKKKDGPADEQGRDPQKSGKSGNSGNSGGGGSAKSGGGGGGGDAKGAAESGGGEGGADGVRSGEWSEDRPRPKWRTFAGPGSAEELLRIAFTRQAYSDLIAHTKSNLGVEVCGVLIGYVCEDERGLHVAVDHAIAGAAAKEGGGHVTFTQDTWNHIHEVKDRDFPKQQIVGWYHSHPGFGVEFSDMDTFIQRNFFGGPAQVALVTDPVGGEDAALVNVEGETRYVRRFWIDGRERRAHVPADAAGDGDGGEEASAGADGNASARGGSGGASGGAAASTAALESIERRLDQVLQIVEDQRKTQLNIWFFIGMVVAVGVAFAITWTVYQFYTQPPKPPELIGTGWSDRPVLIDGKQYYVGVNLTKWMPPQDEIERKERQVAALVLDELLKRPDAVEALKQLGLVVKAPATQPATAPGGR